MKAIEIVKEDLKDIFDFSDRNLRYFSYFLFSFLILVAFIANSYFTFMQNIK